MVALGSVGHLFGSSGGRLGVFWGSILGGFGGLETPFLMLWGALGVHLGPLQGHLAALGGPWGHHAFMWSPKGVHSVPLWPLRGVFWDHFSLNLRTHFLYFRGFVFRLIFILFFGMVFSKF